MAYGIGDTFQRDAIGGDLDRGGQGRQRFRYGLEEMRSRPVASFICATWKAQGFEQAQFVQRRGRSS
ncbi:MAG: hypothetical protein R2851_20250 [Caldilineaceae bacterium]